MMFLVKYKFKKIPHSMKNILIIILFFFTTNLFAQRGDTLTLWKENENYSYENDTFPQNVIDLYGKLLSVSLVTADYNIIQHFKNYQYIKVALSTVPNGKENIQIFRIDSTYSRGGFWSGRSTTDSCALYLNMSKLCISGYINFLGIPHGVYNIRYKHNNQYYIFRTIQFYGPVKDKTLSVPIIDSLEKKNIDTTFDCDSYKSSTKELRILVAYTNTAALYLTGSSGGPPMYADMKTYSDQLLYQLQQVFLNSHINLIPVLVCCIEAPFNETLNWNTDLNKFRVEYNNKDYVKHYTPDICLLVIRNTDINQSGNSFRLSLRGINPGAQYAYGVMDCLQAITNLTFSHEVGHLFGCEHNQANLEHGSNILYSYGYGFNNIDFGTIMSYNTNRILWFSNSNPAVTFGGINIGHCGTEDNSRVINETSGFVTVYRIPPLNLDLNSTSKLILDGSTGLNSFGDAVATSKITLHPGFKVEEGCLFNASIVPGEFVKKIPPSVYDKGEIIIDTNHTLPNSLCQVLLFPNPCSNSVDIKGIYTNSTVIIYSSVGEVLRTFNNLTTNSKINLSDFSAGLYVLKLYCKDGSKTFKIIKTE